MIDSLSIRSTDSFVLRHIGPRPAEIREMLEFLKLDSLAELIDQTIPAGIRPKSKLSLPACGSGRTEGEALADLRALAARNQVFKSFIGMGYSDCFTPPVLQRNLLENPGWYTPYTPYQSEISQGRLEALLNFQTMVADLTGMEIANASLLDEGTAAAEAMSMCLAISGGEGRAFFVSERCHPTTIAIVEARAEPRGIEVIVGDHRGFSFDRPIFGALLQYPATDGAIYDYTDFIEKAHHAGALAVVAADILALALLKPPGEMDADIVVGNTQRFGVPLGYGGPHAAYLATRDRFRRQIPGRIVGVSRDTDGRPGLRLALQTREQHIRRDRATSNICTAQVLLAVVASMYAVYHGPEGIREIAERTHRNAATLCAGLRRLGHQLGQDPFFDTLTIPVTNDRRDEIAARARAKQMNLRVLDGALGISLDETSTIQDLDDLLQLFAPGGASSADAAKLEKGVDTAFPANLARKSGFLTHPVFSRYRSETEFMRYLNRLREKDVSLANSMIPLGSCTMKLNAAVEMAPVTWPEFGRMHPFAPLDQAEGYHELRRRLETMLAEITGFDAVSLQPNAGSQGEYAGLLVIRKFHHDRGEQQRNVCLIPESAHGTNPASAAMAGMKIVVIVCDEHGNIDVEDLRQRAEEHRDTLAALMVTYPSTHGVFEERITEICDIVHRCGGQVYMDGANMNAQVGICRPGDFGADVCHLNLHKTFCIPHGGGGPGMGPIGVQAHLAPYLPTHAVIPTGGDRAIGEIASAPWGSPSILPIPYTYISLMGSQGLTLATQIAILNANYVARRLEPYYPVLYKGSQGFVAHECIVNTKQFRASTGIEVEDVAKRLIDYGFHAPTVSFPEVGMMMIEPTESESKVELDRFCDAMIAIRKEIKEIEEGRADRADNVLKNAPHTAAQIASDEWTHPYTREKAAFPAPWTRESKYWPPVARIDNVYGERHVVCSCPPMEEWLA